MRLGPGSAGRRRKQAGASRGFPQNNKKMAFLATAARWASANHSTRIWEGSQAKDRHTAMFWPKQTANVSSLNQRLTRLTWLKNLNILRNKLNKHQRTMLTLPRISSTARRARKLHLNSITPLKSASDQDSNFVY